MKRFREMGEQERERGGGANEGKQLHTCTDKIQRYMNKNMNIIR